MGSILSIDYGLKRVGLAISDENKSFAFPLSVIENNGTKKLINKIKEIILERDIDLIVVGMPFNMDKTKGEMAEKVEVFVKLLKNETNKTIETVDERLTSFVALENLKETKLKGKKLRKYIDSESARLILQEFLEGYNGRHDGT